MNNENERNYWVIGIVVVLLIIGVIFFTRSSRTSTNNPNATSTSDEIGGATSTLVRPYGKTTLGIGETGQFNGVSIKPLAVTEDSRCPSGVQCIQAGTVKVNIEATLDSGVVRQSTVELGKPVKIDTFTVTLVSVDPQTKANKKIENDDYEFVFEVRQAAVVDNGLIGK
jgi:hypothetical protein